MTDQLTTAWGGVANDLLPEGIRAAFGARLIVKQDGLVDWVHDRCDYVGDRDLCRELAHALTIIRDAIDMSIRRRLRDVGAFDGIDTRKAASHIIHDTGLIMVGNTNASAGYLYVVAWKPQHMPEGATTRGFERTFEAQAAEREKAEATA